MALFGNVVSGQSQTCASAPGKQSDDISKTGKGALTEEESPKTTLKPLGWNPYTRKDSSEILHWLVEHNEYGRLASHVIWKKMEKEGVCRGRRTWQSMKGHFR